VGTDDARRTDRYRIAISDRDIKGSMHELARGAIRLHILHHAEAEPIHGAWMADELAEHGYAVSPGTLYPTLHRLEEEGLLTSRRDVVDGRARRVYRITPRGRAALREDRRILRELADEVLP
jgi:DNA-binding PadR family transcriptional regulator